MTTRRPWQVWLIFVGVFIAGGVAGGFVSLRVAKALVERGRGSDFGPHMMKRLNENLGLTETQQAAIQPLVDRAWEDLRRTRRESIEAMRTMEAAVTELLTPEQRATYDAIQAEQRERWRKISERRDQRRREMENQDAESSPPPGPPPGPPPPGSPPPS